MRAAHRGFGDNPKIRKLADLRLKKKLKAALTEVCDIRVLLGRPIEATICMFVTNETWHPYALDSQTGGRYLGLVKL